MVTASRRNSSIREIPTAISAYSGDRLAESHIENLVDLASSVPNLSLGSYSTNANITIRGIGNDFTTAGSDPGVAFHLDGVYMADTGLTLSSLLDVNRVEILRGPQGTLFGRNATGGALDVIPNTPTTTLSYGVDASVGGGPTEDHVAGFLSGPLTSTGDFLGRIAVQQTFNQGFTDNLAPNGPKHLDDQNNYSGRAQLEWRPTTAFNARLSLEYQKGDDNGPAEFNVGQPDTTVPLPAAIAGQPVGDLKDRKTYANQGVDRLESKSATLVMNWDVAGGSIKGTFNESDSRHFTDTDGDGTPVDFTDTRYRQHIDQQFAELVFASNPKTAFTYVLGANFFHEKEYQDINVPISFLPAPGVDLGGRIGTYSYAAFTHSQYAWSNGLKIFAGARVTDDEKHIDEFNNFVGTASQSKQWLRITYEVGTSYDFSRAITGYMKYATGYKGGGFSAGSLGPAFNPETDKSIEAGLKGSYFDGILQANLAAFHTDYQNLQVSQTIGVLSEVTNAARATVDGVEAETVFRPSSALHFDLSAGWLNARFDDFLTSDSARPMLGVLSLAGNLLPEAPHFNASVGGYYDLPISAPGKLTLGAQYEWKSRLYFSEFNLPVSSQNAVGKLNLTANYSSEDHHWVIGVYARNVTDETIKNNVLVVSALLGSVGLAQLQPGREIGVALHYRY